MAVAIILWTPVTVMLWAQDKPAVVELNEVQKLQVQLHSKDVQIAQLLRENALLRQLITQEAAKKELRLNDDYEFDAERMAFVKKEKKP